MLVTTTVFIPLAYHGLMLDAEAPGSKHPSKQLPPQIGADTPLGPNPTTSPPTPHSVQGRAPGLCSGSLLLVPPLGWRLAHAFPLQTHIIVFSV